MKKFLLSALAIGLVVAATQAIASVGLKCNGADCGGDVSVLNFINTDGVTRDGGEVTVNIAAKDTVAAGVRNGGATSMTTTEEAVPVSYSLVRKNIAADAAYNDGTLADGKPGQIMTFFISERQGSGTFIVTPETATGWEKISFDAVGETTTFLFTDTTNGWIIIANEGGTITQPSS